MLTLFFKGTLIHDAGYDHDRNPDKQKGNALQDLFQFSHTQYSLESLVLIKYRIQYSAK